MLFYLESGTLCVGRSALCVVHSALCAGAVAGNSSLAAAQQLAAAALQLLCSGYLTAALPRQSPLFGAQSLKIFSCAQTRRHKAFSFHQLQKSQAYREAQILI